MNDEIKEILDNFEKYEARYKLHNETQFIITYREIQILLDYITNLQQRSVDIGEYNTLVNEYNEIFKENKNLKSQLKGTTHCYDEEEYKNLQQENERLKEDLKGQEKLTLSYCKSEQDYKSRCEKAVEYINENKHLSMFADCREPEEDWNYDLECSANDLLNILQNGSDSQ